MIYTLTLNPAIDYVIQLDGLMPGTIHKTTGENIFPGGKGINVSLVLKTLGIDSTALGFIAGFTGFVLKDELESRGINCDFVQLDDGLTRINVKLRHGKETDINACGPYVSDSKTEELLQKTDMLCQGDTLVLSGSIPKTLDESIYQRIMSRLVGKGVNFIVDAKGSLLLNTLKYKPFLIKPNGDELGEIFGTKTDSFEKASFYGNKLCEKGAQNVLVSLGETGAVLCTGNGKTKTIAAHNGHCINSVGAGDSMVAGFIAGYQKTNDTEYALNLANAAGAATAFSNGLAEARIINELMAKSLLFQ